MRNIICCVIENAMELTEKPMNGMSRFEDFEVKKKMSSIYY